MAEAGPKITICIPTYWTNETGLTADDNLFNIYDHPTPIDKTGTIERALNSLSDLKGDFNVVVIGTTTDTEIRDRFQTLLKEKLANFSKLDLFWFSFKELKTLHSLLENEDKTYQKKYVSLDGYGNIRNLCLIAPRLLKSDLALLIDDDEVITDKDYLVKAADFMNNKVDEDEVLGKSGIYSHTNEQQAKRHWWELFWAKGTAMNKFFEEVKRQERLSESPVALGGAMVLHKKLFKEISFDPWILRGEDIDYVINYKLHGYNFYIDNELHALHIPPEKPFHTFSMRQDFYRFIYEAQKLNYAFEHTDLNHFNIDDLDPFPGRFLKKGVSRRALSLSLMTALRDFYHSDVGQHLKLIRVSTWDAKKYAKRNKSRWFGFQKLWPTFMEEIQAIDPSQVLTPIE